ncbi:MAG TPA: sugar ABC transporter substrate-binding protein [Aggregatilineales bacterium]|nr:sugar ABC transporter substrate-binding protein [Aggregatilineales bacterium]
MKSSRRFSALSIAIATTLLLSVANIPIQAQSSAVQLRYALWDSGQQPAYQACADAFTKANPNITVAIEQAGWSEYWSGLTTELVSGTAPDVFTNHLAHYPELLSKNQLLDIQSFVTADKVDTSIYTTNPDLLVKDGKRYGLPQDGDTIAIFYNADMFQKAGVTADEIAGWTWNPQDGGTFQKSIAKLTLDSSGRNGLDPKFDKTNVVQWGFMGGPGDASSGAQPDWSAFAASTGYQATDGPWTTKYHYDDPRVADTVQWWADLHLKFGFAPDSNQLSSGEDSVFLAGKAAMFPMGSWDIATAAGATFKVGFAELPAGPMGRKTPVNGLAPAIYAGTKHPKEAWQWVKFLTSPDCANIVGDHAVVFPAIQSGIDRALEGYKKKGLDVSAFTKIRAEKNSTFLLPVTDHISDVTNMLQPVLQDIFDGKTTAKEALPKINTQINALFTSSATAAATAAK